MQDRGEKQSVRVLIADDQRPTRQGLRALLALLPHPVEVIGEAANGQDAVRLTVANQPDVVLMDMRMPVMDGLEATRRIKSRHPNTGIVMLTIYDDPSNHERAACAGVDAFIKKGAPLDQVLAAIHRFAKTSGA